MKRPERAGNIWGRAVIALVALIALIGIALQARAEYPSSPSGSPAPAANTAGQSNKGTAGTVAGKSYKNDVSPPLRDMPQIPPKAGSEHEASPNWLMQAQYPDLPDTVVQRRMAPLAMPTPILNFDGTVYP